MNAYEEGVKYLCNCNLISARKYFAMAARQFEKMADPLAISNTAICFFHGAEYSTAIVVAKKSNEDNEILQRLIKGCLKRLRHSYWEEKTSDYIEMKSRNMHKDIISLIREDPYLLLPHQMALQMFESTSALGMVEVANSFKQNYLSLK